MRATADYEVTAACQCGATLTGTASTLGAAAGLAELFWTLHKGLGHGWATLRQARNARRRAERRLRREWEADR